MVQNNYFRNILNIQKTDSETKFNLYLGIEFRIYKNNIKNTFWNNGSWKN